MTNEPKPPNQPQPQPAAPAVLHKALADGRPLTPLANIDAMSRYATEPATDLA